MFICPKIHPHCRAILIAYPNLDGRQPVRQAVDRVVLAGGLRDDLLVAREEELMSATPTLQPTETDPNQHLRQCCC